MCGEIQKMGRTLKSNNIFTKKFNCFVDRGVLRGLYYFNV